MSGSLRWEQVSELHKYLFPDATLQSTMKDFETSVGKYLYGKTEEDKLAALAGCLISLAGVYRFSPELAETTSGMLLHHASFHTKNIENLSPYLFDQWVGHIIEQKVKM